MYEWESESETETETECAIFGGSGVQNGGKCGGKMGKIQGGERRELEKDIRPKAELNRLQAKPIDDL